MPATQAVQDLFDLLTKGIATSLKFPTVAAWLATEGHTIYHFTINAMGSHTVWHTDELPTDAPGPGVFNTSLSQCGMFLVVGSDPKDKKERVRGCWNVPGDTIAFNGKVRMRCEHAVYREYPNGTNARSHRAHTQTHTQPQ